jgi:preprotein translocase subunit SecG
MLKKVLFLGVLLSLLIIPAVFAAPDYGLGETGDLSGYNKNDNVYSLIGTVIKATLAILAIVFFGLLLFAGLRWMTARGNPAFVEKARSIMEAAIIGLIIVVAAYGITTFIFNRLGGGQAEQSSGGDTGTPPPGKDAPDACFNKTKDGFETDIDCGGRCLGCAEGKSCIKSIDCSSFNCDKGKCSTKICSGSDFECGGDCPDRCGIGLKCAKNGDCVSNKCVAGRCAAGF